MTPRFSEAVHSVTRLLFAMLLVSTSLTVFAQNGPGDPKPDINLIGPTRDPADIRDEGLKQQNEPACAMRPGDSDCIICFFNDYRTVDVAGHEDAWIGQAESCDAADTWTSRIVPGHPNHPYPIDAQFAADPRVIALPGMAIHGFIGGFRDQDRGVIAVQHWLENNKDDFDYYEPGRETIIVDSGTEGRFIDKPEFLAVLSELSPQDTVSISTPMENSDLGTITREYPAGTLYAAYAVFTGSQSVKLLVKTSDDWGDSWRNRTTKLTESQNLVSGITMTSMNGIVIAMWRQALDINDFDALYYATTLNGGQSWSKPVLLTNICKFDQPSATTANPPQVTFRTNDFPWTANDGKNIYAFYTERAGDCETGVPKVVMRYSADGVNWSGPQPVDAGPEAAPGAQFMPAAFGARGKVQVAWYDTRRESIPIGPSQPEIADYIPENGLRVNRKVDVYTARITADAPGGPVSISDSVRVSRYRAVSDVSDPNGPKYEIEASFSNAMMYRSGLLAFLGDYMSVTAQEFRPNGSDGWEANYSPLPAPASNLVDFFVAYADHRDVRGDVLFGDGAMTKPYTPPVNEPPTESTADLNTNRETVEDSTEIATGNASEHRQSAEGVDDAFTDPNDPANACFPGTDADRTRDANIYGSLIRDLLRLSTPVESRPLSGILRAIPFTARNVTSEEKPYRLFIASQPGLDPVWHRASFRQRPDRPPFLPERYPELSSLDPVLIENVSIRPNSTVARTVFIVSTDREATVDVQVFDGVCAAAADAANPMDPFAFASACNVLGSITIGGSSAAGLLQQPGYLSSACAGDPDCADVQVTELHNPLLENPLLENPLLENPLLENPLLENPELEAPLLENPLLENPLLENYGFENPLLENPLLENPLLENPLLENPLLENPLLENPLLENSALDAGITYTDVTAVIRNDGNVTTAYNVDATASGFTNTAGGEPVSQLIVWKQYAYGTSRDCQYVPEARNQVIATINQPDDLLSIASIEEPFNGETSLLLAPGERGYVTYRFFGTVDELDNANINGFTASSQAANCDEFDDEFGPPTGQEDDFYTCEQQIAADRELILLDIDTTGPTFDGLTEGQVIPVPAIEANAPGGACVDPVASGLVSATDESPGDVEISCFNSEGDEICTLVGDTGLSIPVANLISSPGPSPMTCVATDEVGNSTSVNVFVEVLDTSSPFFTAFAPNPTVVNANATTGTATLVLENGFAAEDVDGVDSDPVISCVTDTGLVTGDQLPAGPNIVDCVAIDASGNLAQTSYVVQVNDVTDPVITLIGDNPQTVSAGQAYVEFGATAADNVGIVGGVVISGSVNTSVPGSYTITYSASDAAGNTVSTTRTVLVVDTGAPDISVPSSTVFEMLQSAAGAIVDYDSLVSATDQFDPSPTLDCVPASGTLFPVGETTVDCTATDASGNTATASFQVFVGYAGGVGITPNKLTSKAGSSNPLTWAWQDDSGNNIDSSNDRQILRIINCSSGDVVLDSAGDPGASGFRVKTDLSWEFNWQSDDEFGNPLPKGTYCASVTSELTGQMLSSPPIRLN